MRLTYLRTLENLIKSKEKELEKYKHLSLLYQHLVGEIDGLKIAKNRFERLMKCEDRKYEKLFN